jgi:surface protein
MFELIGRNKKKNHILFLIILFSIKFSPINQFPFQAKGTKEQNEAFDTRTIGYKVDKASTTYDKKFHYIDQSFNESTQNFFAIKNLADSKLSFNPLPNYNKTEQLNENLSREGLRNLQNANYIIAYVNGSQGDQVQVINAYFSDQPDSVTINETNATWNYGKVNLTQTGVNAIKMVWNQNLKNMSNMFNGTSALASLNLSKFDTSQVTKMSRMFEGCSALTSIDLSKFNTSQVKDMSRMFEGCSALTSIDLSKFDTSQVKKMDRMFEGCSALTSIDLSKFNTSQVTKMGMMFEGCSALTSLDLSKFDTSQVNDMSNMFNGSSALASIDLSKFYTSQVKKMSSMFK